LFSVGEVSRPEWKKKLEQDFRSHLGSNIPKKVIPGYISILNFLYTVTEIFEFAARLCERLPCRGELEVSIRLKGIEGFALVADWDRSWDSYYAVQENELGHSWTMRTDALISEARTFSLKAVMWFFERFGWLEPSEEVLSSDQQRFLTGKF
jgi:hypothetical protein